MKQAKGIIHPYASRIDTFSTCMRKPIGHQHETFI